MFTLSYRTLSLSCCQLLFHRNKFPAFFIIVSFAVCLAVGLSLSLHLSVCCPSWSSFGRVSSFVFSLYFCRFNPYTHTHTSRHLFPDTKIWPASRMINRITNSIWFNIQCACECVLGLVFFWSVVLSSTSTTFAFDSSMSCFNWLID